jgi:signal peptidase II
MRGGALEEIVNHVAISRAALRWLYFGIAVLVIVADRLTKIVIRNYVELNFGSITIIPGCFSITHVENTGAAFSLLADWPARVRVPLLVGFSMLALVIVGYLLWNSATRFTWAGVALALILGGAIGNLYDRLFYGQVTDFVHFYIGSHAWPDFNLADSAICVGAVLLSAQMLFAGKTGQAH